MHWCLAANLRIDIYNGEMVFNRLLGNGWSDLDDLSGRPHEISIPIKWSVLVSNCGYWVTGGSFGWDCVFLGRY